MSYQYDIFLSYRRSKLRNEWLTEHFVPLFWEIAREEIAGETGRPPSGLFFDLSDLSEDTRDTKGDILLFCGPALPPLLVS